MKVPGTAIVLSNGENNNDSKDTCPGVLGTVLSTLHILAYLIPDKADTITISIL